MGEKKEGRLYTQQHAHEIRAVLYRDWCSCCVVHKYGGVLTSLKRNHNNISQKQWHVIALSSVVYVYGLDADLELQQSMNVHCEYLAVTLQANDHFQRPTHRSQCIDIYKSDFQKSVTVWLGGKAIKATSINLYDKRKMARMMRE